MSKFKVGDAVVPTKGDPFELFHHWMEYWAKGGDVRPTKFYIVGFSKDGDYVIYNADRGATDGPYIYPRDLQLAPYTSCAAAEVDNLADEYGGARKASSNGCFKVGDRVRFITAQPNYGAEPYSGELIIKEIGGGDWGDDVDLIYADYPRGHYTQIARLVDIEHVTAAPATATTIRIEAGKFYKTRDGRKALVSVNNLYDQDAYPFYHEVDGKSWHAITNDGKSCIGYDHCDLIAEWTDEPVAAAPKFKVGDRVKNINVPEAGVGIVTEVRSDGEYQVHYKDTWYSYCTDYESDIVAAPTTIADIVASHSQTGTAIVAVLQNGQPRPSTRPYVHTTASAAETEANRLARTNPGKEFGVYTLGAVTKVEKTYEHEWQRLAASGRVIEAIKELRAKTGLYLKTAKDAVEDWRAREAA